MAILTVSQDVRKVNLTVEQSGKVVTIQPVVKIKEPFPETVEAYISDPTVQGLLENVANWNGSGVYIGSGITGTYQGQKHYDAQYFFEAINDNIWIRLTRI